MRLYLVFSVLFFAATSLCGVCVMAFARSARRQFRCAYGGGWWRSVGRTLGVFVTYLLLVGLAFAAIIGSTIASTRPS